MREIRAASRIPGDHEDRVVAGNGAGDLRQPGPVDSGREEVGRARRRPQYDEIGAWLGRDEQLAEQPGQSDRRCVLGASESPAARRLRG